MGFPDWKSGVAFCLKRQKAFLLTQICTDIKQMGTDKSVLIRNQSVIIRVGREKNGEDDHYQIKGNERKG